MILLGVSILAARSIAGEVTRLKVGFAERDITPEIGMEIPGNYMKAFHTKLHDPCKVRAVVFDDGASPVVMVGVDALMVPRHLVLAVRTEVQARLGIAPQAVLIGASHSHSSGPTGMVQPGEYDHASPLVKKLAYEQSSAAHAGYLVKVRDETIAVICQAYTNRTPAVCGVGTGIEDQAGYNRRFHMKNGMTFTHPGKGNPEIEKVAGPIDPQVGVIGVWDQAGKFLGCVVNYACHATTSPGGISANWIHYLEKVIRGSLGSDSVVVFLQGFCGDVTQVDNLSPYNERPAEEGAQYVGARVGAEAVKVLVSMARGNLAPLRAAATTLSMGRRVPDAARVKASLELAQQEPKKVNYTDWIFAKEIAMLDAQIAREPRVDVEAQVIQVGPVLLLTSPGEVFCQYGLDLKARSKFPFTFPVELANGCVGYIPTEEALGKNGGGYETRLTSYSSLQPDAGRLSNDALIKLAGDFVPGNIPQRPPAAVFKAPWAYGNVAPELR
jgi:hypothetical protein